MTRRRIILLITIVTVLGLLAGGVYWYTNRYGNVKNLVRAELALRAGKFEKAAELAGTHIAEFPDDWRGYELQAHAYIRAGRYEAARGPLGQAAQRFPDEMQVSLLLARTYSHPGRQLMDSTAGARSADVTRQALAQFRQARQILLAGAQKVLGPEADAEAILVGGQGVIPIAAFREAPDGLVLLEETGLNFWLTARAHKKLGGQLSDEAKTAKDARARPQGELDRLVRESALAIAESRAMIEVATRQLLAVAEADPTQPRALRALVQLSSTPTPVSVLSRLDDLFEAAGCGRIKLTAWRRGMDAAHRGNRLAEEAKAARAAGRDAEARDKTQAGTALHASAESNRMTIVRQLAPLAEAAPARKPLLDSLVGLLVVRNCEPALARIRKLIAAADDPAPVGATQFVMRDMVRLKGRSDVERMGIRQAQTAEFLEGILSRHPEVIEARLARAELAIQMLDLETARKHCDMLKPTESGNRRVRLLHAVLLGLEGHEEEGLRELTALTAGAQPAPSRIPSYTAFARAARRAGGDNETRAMSAMRTVVQLDPGHAEALAFLTERLLAGGHYDRALKDAEAYYDAHPDDPVAIRLLVAALARTNNKPRAQEVLKTARREYADESEMLGAVIAGLDVLGARDEATALAERVATMTPATPGERIAIAGAMIRSGQMDAAEQLLAGANTQRADVAFYLGRIHAARGRMLDALKQFRRAVKLRPHEILYRIRLARTLLNNGNLDACEDVLQHTSGRDWQVDMLRLEVSLLRGKDDTQTRDMLSRLQQSGRPGLPMAIVYFRQGKLEECIASCRAELSKNRNLANAHFLLGQAYLRQDKMERCIEHWTRMAELAKPQRQLRAYKYLALALATENAPEQVAYKLSQLSGAQIDLAHRATGWVLMRRGQFADAAGWYARVANRAEASDYHRRSAKLHLARMLSMTQRNDQALGVLDELIALERWRGRALLDKALIFMATGRSTQAVQTLAETVKCGSADENVSLLRRVVLLYVRLDKPADALATCEILRRIVPKIPGPCLLTARVCRIAGRQDEALTWYRKAVSVQPGNLRCRLDLIRALDAAGHAQDALAALDDLKKIGETSKVVGLFEQGKMLGRWGLQAQALECLEKLQAEGYGQNPGLQLALGRAFGLFGKRDKALAVLSAIPVHTNQYVQAQLLVSQLAEDDAERLKVLEALGETERGRSAAAIRRMEMLVQMDRAQEALDVFSATAGSPGNSPAFTARAESLALVAEVRLGKYKAAADRALAMHAKTKHPHWRTAAQLLMVDDRPDEAADLLPEIDRSSTLEALIGLLVAVKRDDQAARAKWFARIEAIDREGLSSLRRRGVVPQYMFLAALAADRDDKARDVQAVLEDREVVLRSISAEAGSMSAERTSPDEAAALLRASLATEVGLGTAARVWAMQALKARPTCQWAGAIIFWRAGREADYDKVVSVLKPPYCVVAQAMQAAIHMRKHEYAQAAHIYARIVGKDEEEMKKNAELVLRYAQTLEMQGKFPQAMAQYAKVWEWTEDPAAANSWAYLVAQAYPKDAEKLAESQQVVQRVLKKRPNDPMLLDTAGWIAYLQGRHDEAVGYLRMAIKALPGIPDVHYHLGLAEAAANRKALARWHLSAAVSIGQIMKDRKQHIGPGTVEAIAHARAALEQLQ